MSLASTRPIRLQFEEGIDRKALQQLRERFLAVNRARRERALSLLGERQQRVMILLPLILHANHPALPGYLNGDCPRGLSSYEPDAAVMDLARRESRSFQWRKPGRRAPDLLALFGMGSPGTIAHTAGSDLDLWLCHREDLPEEGRRKLLRKTAAIEEWARQQGLELHIFLVTGAQLREGRVDAEVDAENCGSAQHYLLLDEFYRTAIHLAGRVPLWWLIPAERETDYRSLADHLLHCRFIRESDYVDFGPVPSIPPGEFLGAGVWQLYKGIDAPWKAILKLLLIESYAQGDHAEPLALTFKRSVFEDASDVTRLDPYMLLYRRLEAYLEGLGAGERLELVRRSFYLKVAAPLSRSGAGIPGWRLDAMRQLVRAWGWGERQIRRLDNRHRWRVEEVLEERRLIINELTHSYRFLSRLARSRNLISHIRQQDMTLLGRKLYAAFQRKAGKIELINPSIAPGLAEENLSFHHRSARGTGTGEGWQLYRDLAQPEDADFQPVIKSSAGLMELLVWCHCNGLLTSGTRLNLQAGDTHLTLTELQSLIQSLRQALPVPLPVPDQAALQAENRLVRTLVFVNVGVDPMRALTERGMHRLSARDDALGYSALRENLVVTLDQVSLSTWAEVSVHRYEAGDTLIQCLKNYLAVMVNQPDKPPALSVHCHSAAHASVIGRRVGQLFADVTEAFFGSGRDPAALRYVIEMDQRYFILQFTDKQPRFLAFSNRDQLFDALGRPQSRYSPIRLDRRALRDDPALRAVVEAGEAEAIQIFYEVRGDQARVWLMDEQGALCQWKTPFQGSRRLLVPLLRFLDNVQERRQLRQGFQDGGLPPERSCHELVPEAGGYRLEERGAGLEGAEPDGLEVQALGVAEGDGPLRFDLFCDHQEFSALEYGDRLWPAVAHFILSRRHRGDAYPIYITDLNLPHDLDPRDYQQELHTIQYIQYKLALEHQLNRAMSAFRGQ